MTFYLYTTLDDPSATAGTYATGLNDSGEIVGYYIEGNTRSGFVYNGGTYSVVALTSKNNTTQFQSIGTIDGINNLGQISGSGGYSIWTSPVGGSGGPNQPTPGQELLYDSSDGFFAATSGGSSWTPIEAEIVRGAISNEVTTYGYGINSAGDVVGYFQQSGHNNQAYIWSPSSPITIINYPGATSTEAFGINGQNQVVGTWVGQDSYFPGVTTSHGFLYYNGSWSYFDDPFGVNGTFPEGINNSDVIVGYYVDANAKSHGFIFNEATGTYFTLDISGAVNTFIYGINNGGEIVGAYVDSSGNTHGFEATPLPANGGNNDIWVLSGGYWEASAQPGSHPAGYNVAAIGDWTGGTTDGILWFNSTTGDTDEWQLSNAAWAASVDLGAPPGQLSDFRSRRFLRQRHRRRAVDQRVGRRACRPTSGNWPPTANGRRASARARIRPATPSPASAIGPATAPTAFFGTIRARRYRRVATRERPMVGQRRSRQPSRQLSDCRHRRFLRQRPSTTCCGPASTATAPSRPTSGNSSSNGKWMASVSPGTHPAGYQVVGVGDFTGNGTSDILWYDAVDRRCRRMADQQRPMGRQHRSRHASRQRRRCR